MKNITENKFNPSDDILDSFDGPLTQPSDFEIDWVALNAFYKEIGERRPLTDEEFARFSSKRK